MKEERTRYRERTPWPGLAHAVLWASVVLSCYPILAGWDGDLPDGLRWPLVGAIVAVVGAIHLLVGGLTILIKEKRIVTHLGSIPLVKTSIPFSDIVGLRSVRYRPIREFGGWGLRGFGRRRAWTARGDRAVVLALRDGREILLGSDQPLRLEERIRTLGGTRLGTPEAAFSES